MLSRVVLVLTLAVPAAFAQLTTEQRLSDFRALGDLYARRYAALEWKKNVFQLDALDLRPWLDRVKATKNDLEFYDLMVGYVASLQDAHDQFLLPSDFQAHLGFSVDIYDGKVLIDGVDRTILPLQKFPFGKGDQLVSLDGRTADDLVKAFSPYVSGGNPRTVARLAAELITDRYQAAYPFAAVIGDTATAVILRQNGDTETYTIPWVKDGTELTSLGASPGPIFLAKTAKPRPAAAAAGQRSYQGLLARLRNYSLPGRQGVIGFGSLQPAFALPHGFVQRLGGDEYDSYFSGVYTTDQGIRIGFLRVPDFMYPYERDLDKEIRYFDANTDVLVVDVTRNAGGYVCATEDLAARLTRSAFRGVEAELRVGWTDVLEIKQAVAEAKYYEDDAEVIAQLQAFADEYQKAYFENNGRTRPLSLCSDTGTQTGLPYAFHKPVLVLVDEMTASAGEIFAALVQDNQLAPLFGYRTMGAGGSPEPMAAGIYSEGTTYVTRALVARSVPIVTPDYPTTRYIENIGVRPKTVNDIMTFDNLINDGAPFVKAFTALAVEMVQAAGSQ